LTGRCPSAKPLFVAELKGHRFRFHKRSIDGSAKADAEYTGNDSDVVLGIVFNIDDSEEGELDQAEGKGNGYTKDIVEVADENDIVYQVKIYRADRAAIDQTLRPYSWYKRFVIEGAIQHNLPENYINQINQFEVVEDSDRNRDGRNRAINC
jgi:gamma-glutamylcyclotransferase (GGCT)/AIG2-like uncharacterized protein YtfP